MKKLTVLGILLLSACSSQWPAGSYNGLPKDTDSDVLTTAIGDCAVNLVPDHAMIKLVLPVPPDALSMVLPERLSHDGISVSEIGLPVSYIVAADGPDAFIRVSAPRGTCAQYFSRDTNGLLQNAGPIMVVAQ